MGAREIGIELEGLLEHGLRGIRVPFLHPRAGDIHPPVGVFRIELRDRSKGALGSLQVALQEQSDPIVVPALAVLGIERQRLGERRRIILHQGRHHGDGHTVLLDHHDGQIRNPFELGRDLREVAGEDPMPVVIVLGYRGWLTRIELWLARSFGDAGKGELRVPPTELAIVQLGGERNRVAAV